MACVCLSLTKVFFFLQLLISLLLSTSINAVHILPSSAEAPHAHHHHHAATPVKSPVYPPVKAPVHSPVQPPVQPPVEIPAKPPSYNTPQRKLVAVQGVVYCKSCKYRGVDTLTAAAPLLGAVVNLQCNNTKYPLREQTKTDKNGYFFFMPQKLTTSGSHKCKVFLASSPTPTCSVPTNLHGGAAGAPLIPAAMPHPDSKYLLFTVGPFAFEPHNTLPCAH